MMKKGARSKLRDYFLAHVGEVLDTEMLRNAAGGISEWARRVRELIESAINGLNNNCCVFAGSHHVHNFNVILAGSIELRRAIKS